MKQQLIYPSLFCLLFLFWAGPTYAQSGFVSGKIADADGLPLPGVNILIKGKNKGTQTDFDGDYRIACAVGDILVISYIGSQTREVVVTRALFGERSETTVIRKKAVETILDSTYQSEVRKNLPSFLIIPSIEESPKTYHARHYLNPSRIKEITTYKDKVKITYFDSDIFFEVGGSSSIGAQFIQKRNLPEVQKTMAQGVPTEGSVSYVGPSSDLPFSYGPPLSDLEFDGNTNPFDRSGNLVPAGNGIGRPATSYDNSPFQTVLKRSNTLFFNIATDDVFYGFDYANQSGKDLYGAERSRFDAYSLRFNNSRGYHDLEWDAHLKHVKSVENQPNINGFQNNLLRNALATPPSFENQQGGLLPSGTQRSFSPSHFNNPEWLLNSNRNQFTHETWIAVLNNQLELGGEADLKSKLGYRRSKNKQRFGLFKHTVGFPEGYSSDKLLDKNTFDANISLDWDAYDKDFELASSLFYSNENLVYRLSEQTGFNEGTFTDPQNTVTRNRDISRALFRWFTRFDFRFLKDQARVSFINNSFTATKQNSKWFLPTLQFRYEFARNWYSDFIHRLNVSTSFGYDINYLDLFYENQSHNSLRLLPGESDSYIANNDLFTSDAVRLEEKKGYELGLDIGFELFDQHWSLNSVFYNNTIDGSVFPIWENDQYVLRNLANIRNSGMECTFDTTFYSDISGLRFTPKLVFSTYRNTVLDLLVATDRIPIAGFSSVSRNLIKGASAGVLVGSRYARDAQHNVIIDAEGFPMVDPEAGIIGDPIPDFNLGFSSTLAWKGFALDLVLDYQKGGDLWNGTQNVLNYLGTSKQSAIERTFADFVFQGVNAQGQPNTIPVDFAHPENGLEGNRFVRYGFEGVAEAAIVDGSYFNLKSINLTYTRKMTTKNPFFREIRVGTYGNNLLTLSKFRGATPYSNLFDQASSQGLHFFNNPIISEIGVQVNLKI